MVVELKGQLLITVNQFTTRPVEEILDGCTILRHLHSLVMRAGKLEINTQAQEKMPIKAIRIKMVAYARHLLLLLGLRGAIIQHIVRNVRLRLLRRRRLRLLARHLARRLLLRLVRRLLLRLALLRRRVPRLLLRLVRQP